MNYLSETTRKERRSLLAAGFIGIVVAQLKIYPSEIDIWGLKFHSPDLPFIVVSSLCAVIGYFLIKFFSSYMFEKSSSTSDMLESQILRGRTSLDVFRAEQELDEAGTSLLTHKHNHRIQLEGVEKSIKSLQEQRDQEATSHVATLKVHNEKISDLQEILASTPSDYLRESDTTLTTRENVENQLQALEEARKTYLLDMENKRLKDAEKLKNEMNGLNELSERLKRDLQKEENIYEEKRNDILRWKKTHEVVGWIHPFHLLLEVWLPILLGLYAILSLGYLMFHLPPPSKPPIFPVL